MVAVSRWVASELFDFLLWLSVFLKIVTEILLSLLVEE